MAKPTMNAALRAARKKFANQKGTVKAGYDNTPFNEGKYVACVERSEVTDPEGKHEITARIAIGDDKGRLTPKIWVNDLTDPPGAFAFVKNVRSILGAEVDDILSGSKDAGGETEFQYGDIVDHCEDLAHRCLGEYIEVAIVNRKENPKRPGAHLKDDGTPWQNCYINRGLGDDAAAVLEAGAQVTPTQRVSASKTGVTGKGKAAKKKVVAKKVVAKKKVAKKKVARKR